MRDYLILVGNLILFTGAFTFLGICSAHDTSGNPWYGAARGAIIGVLFGLVFGVGMQDRGNARAQSQRKADRPRYSDDFSGN